MISASYWVDLMGEIVSNVRSDANNPATGDAPYYMYGHPLEVINTLAEKDLHSTYKYMRYPLIALFQDFEESNLRSMTAKSSVSLNIIIADLTSPDYKSDQRYTNVFKTVLYPLYNLLIYHIQRSGLFSNVGPGLVPHNKIDRLSWGRQGLSGNEGAIGFDHIDAIEIQNLELELLHVRKCNT